MDFEDFFADEDEIFLEYLNYNRPRRPRILRARKDLFNYHSDEEFLIRYRLTKETVMELFIQIEKEITPRTMRNNAVAPMNRLLATLRFYATGTFMAWLADFGGISETSARDFVSQTSTAIAELRPRYLRFPNNFDDVKAKFYAIAQFPHVLMAIDCIHVKIISPGGDDAEVYRNKNGYFSLKAQTVCDSELRVFDCVARWPGSAHDQEIFNNSRLKYRLEHGEFGEGFVVGDAAYENRPYLVTPLTRATSKAEELYNESIIKTRSAVEHCYGVMQQRFPVISLGLRCSVKLAKNIIQAVVVLHNMALHDPLPQTDIAIGTYEDAKITVKRESNGQDSIQRQIINEHFSSSP